MVATISSCTLLGIDALLVDVECSLGRGLPGYDVVGLATTSVKEGATRIRAALMSIGSDLPTRKVTINLAPADLRKPGASLDLPIAAAVMVANGGRAHVLDGLLVIGELGLDGTVRRIDGVLAAAMLAKKRGLRGVVVPRANTAEAAVVEDLEVYGVSHLSQLAAAFDGLAPLALAEPRAPRVSRRATVDMSEVRGQAVARRAIEIAVAGGHNVLLSGPPGTGKTMLARRIPTVLPPLTREEALETTQIYSAVGLANGLILDRPFRAPHHSISMQALLGGGTFPRPGEISLAHHGVLFLDELPEFERAAIESLRQPLEERAITIARVAGSLRLPASFLLVAAANPCPCGWNNSNMRECTCGSIALARYRQRLSGPLLDRIDLQVFVEPLPLSHLRDAAPGESSARMRDRVAEARARQEARLARFGLRCNAEMQTSVLRATCPLDDRGEATLRDLVGRRTYTARSVDRMIKCARTIADLAGLDVITRDCLVEADRYRDVDQLASEARAAAELLSQIAHQPRQESP